MSKATRTLRSNLKAQVQQLAWHTKLHGAKRSTIEMARGLPEYRDESAWIEYWERKIAATQKALGV